VDQTSQPVTSMDELLVGVRGRSRHRKGQCWRGDLLGQSLVRAKAVVVLGIDPKDVLEMACIDDEQMIKAFGPDGSDESFGVCIRVRRPEWGLQDLGTLGPKDLVEACHVLRVTVADQEPDVDPLVDQITRHVPGLLGDPGRVWVSGHAGNPDPSAADFDEEKNIETLQQHCVYAEEVGGDDVRGLGADELPPRGPPARCWSQVVIEEDPGNCAGASQGFPILIASATMWEIGVDSVGNRCAEVRSRPWKTGSLSLAHPPHPTTHTHTHTHTKTNH
jgi:hypothetical protein